MISKLEGLNLSDFNDSDINSSIDNYEKFIENYGRHINFCAEKCVICSQSHNHFSTLYKTFKNDRSTPGFVNCSDCKICHLFYGEHEKIRLVVTTSTLAGVDEFYKKKPNIHVDRIELRGATISEVEKTLINEIGPLCKNFSFDILLVAGLNDFNNCSYSLPKILADILSLKFEIESLNSNNVVNFIPVPLAPKLVRLIGDNHKPKFDRSTEVLLFNRCLSLINSSPVPILENYGLYMILYNSANFIKIYSLDIYMSV